MTEKQPDRELFHVWMTVDLRDALRKRARELCVKDSELARLAIAFQVTDRAQPPGAQRQQPEVRDVAPA